MRQRHVKAEQLNATETLKACRVPIGADFHALASSQVDALLQQADRQRYRRPVNANGSRARYFHDLLQRRALATGSGR